MVAAVPAKSSLPRFHASGWQIVALEAVAAVAAYSLAMLLRFADEGTVPATYAVRTAPWAVLAALLHVGCGQLAQWLRRPRSPLSRHPVAPFLLAGATALAAVLVLNYVFLPVGWRLPLSVAVVGPLLAAAASAAVRIASTRQEIALEALLPRPLVRLDPEACAPALRGKRVLITGAAGSIGSELARQVLAVGPTSLTLLDNNESGLFDVESALAGQSGAASLSSVMANVADQRRVAEVFQQVRPQVVFHAAAYKHVPLVEANPDQGFVTNVLGSFTVLHAAGQMGAERVVVISTDKAVNPASFMGLTKRVAELIVQAMAQRHPGTLFSAVRFGNVLGSRGSLVPTLLRQIDAGEPITITHPDVQRFFMTISEAVSLVLRSASHGQNGSIFVLDMGEEIRIVDLAKRLVRLKGLRPNRDVPFVYVGLRPGEKLREELVGAGETLVGTEHPHVRRVDAAYGVDGAAVLDQVTQLQAERRSGQLDAQRLPEILRALIERTVRPPAPAG